MELAPILPLTTVPLLFNPVIRVHHEVLTSGSKSVGAGELGDLGWLAAVEKGCSWIWANGAGCGSVEERDVRMIS